MKVWPDVTAGTGCRATPLPPLHQPQPSRQPTLPNLRLQFDQKRRTPPPRTLTQVPSQSVTPEARRAFLLQLPTPPDLHFRRPPGLSSSVARGLSSQVPAGDIGSAAQAWVSSCSSLSRIREPGTAEEISVALLDRFFRVFVCRLCVWDFCFTVAFV